MYRFSSPWFFLVLMCLAGFSCTAFGRVWWSGEHQTGSYAMEILVDGVPRTVYSYYGSSYVAGSLGSRYTVRIHNRSPHRVEAVVSVDGRDVLDGTFSRLDKRGYVIMPYSYADIDGFRISRQEVAAFRFTSVPNSYTARMGTPWTVGAIGVALFPEKTHYPRPRPFPPYVLENERQDRDARDQSLGQGSTTERHDPPRTKSSPNLGTQFGERRVSMVYETSFVRKNWSYPAARLSIRYDDRQGLCNRGLAGFCDEPPRPRPPYEPYYPQKEFSEPPPGWEHFQSWY